MSDWWFWDMMWFWTSLTHSRIFKTYFPGIHLNEWGESGRGMKLTAHLHLPPTLKKRSYTSISLCVFMVWRLILSNPVISLPFTILVSFFYPLLRLQSGLSPINFIRRLCMYSLFLHPSYVLSLSHYSTFHGPNNIRCAV
jgi:hypothetical protein